MSYLYLALILSLIFLSASSTVVYAIYDLTSTDANFQCEASKWTASNQRPKVLYTTCNGNYVLGGYNVLGSSLLGLTGITLLTPTVNGDYYQRVYSGIPSHNLIQFSFNLWAIDNWSTSGKFQVKFDNTLIDGFGLNQNNFPGNLCGSSFYDDFQPVKVYGTVIHSATSLTLQVIHYLGQDSNTASVAFRDLNLQFITADNTGLSTSMCAKASITIPSAFDCPCASGQYKLNGVCTACDSSCSSCYGGSSSQCYACGSGYLFNGDKCILCNAACSFCTGTAYNQCSECNDAYWMIGTSTCVATCDSRLTFDSSTRSCTSTCGSNYVLWDGSCATSCTSPLKPGTIENVFTTCEFPCKNTEFAYWNGSCNTTCAFPLTQKITKDRLFCEYPCASGDYLYWNGSCKSSCVTSKTRTEGGKKFCDYPCQPYEHLYWDGSCQASCSYPLTERIENTSLFCDYPCASSGEYLYWDGTCQTSCDYPLKSRTDKSRDFCDFPCDKSQFLYWDQTCSNTCDSPLTHTTQNSRSFCQNSCTQFLYWDGSCQASCDSPLTQRTSGTKQYCDYSCQSSQYLYWDKTCHSSCDAPLTQTTKNGKLLCENSCSQFLYFDGTCKSSCNTPYVQRTENRKQFCDYSCETTQYLYWNGSCGNSCEYPLVSTNVTGKLYCNSACGSDFLYPDGTCQASCTFPYVQTTSGSGLPIMKFCNPKCNSSQYLYPNKTCGDFCPSPYIESANWPIKYCNNPCLTNEYLIWDETCVSACDPPLVIQSHDYGNTCSSPCSNTLDYYHTDTQTCSSSCAANATNEGIYLRCAPFNKTNLGPVIQVIESAGLFEALTQPGGATIISFAKQLQYINYLDVDTTPRLQRLAESKGRPLLSVIQVSAPNFLREMLGSSSSSRLLQGVNHISGGVQSFSPRFIINFWNAMIILMGCGLLAVLFSALEKYTKNKNKITISAYFSKLRVLTKWNLGIIMYAIGIESVIVYAKLEFDSVHFNSAASIISFITCILVIISTLIFFFILLLLLKLPNPKKILPLSPYIDLFKRIRSKKELYAIFESCQVVARGFRKNTRLNRHFYILYIIRASLPMFLACALSSEPLGQMVFQILISVVTLSYIIARKPLKNRLNQVQLVMLESIVLQVNICVFILAILSRNGNKNSEFAVFIGDMIIAGNIAINVIIVIMLFVKLTLEALSIFHSIRTSKKKDYSKWLQLLVVCIQQASFGFEEICLESEEEEEFANGLDPRTLVGIMAMRANSDARTDVSNLDLRKDISDNNLPLKMNEELESIGSKFLKTSVLELDAYHKRSGNQSFQRNRPLGIDTHLRYKAEESSSCIDSPFMQSPINSPHAVMVEPDSATSIGSISLGGIAKKQLFGRPSLFKKDVEQSLDEVQDSFHSVGQSHLSSYIISPGESPQNRTRKRLFKRNGGPVESGFAPRKHSDSSDAPTPTSIKSNLQEKFSAQERRTSEATEKKENRSSILAVKKIFKRNNSKSVTEMES